MGAISANFFPPPPHPHISINNRAPLPSLLRCAPIRNPRPQTLKFVAFAEGNGQQNPKNGGGGDIREESGVGGGRGERRAPRLNIRWRDVLDPDPENIAAVGLAGLLAWASVSVLWQLLFISVAILLAALKYSFIAALLLFILITLL
ncbi:uncharacterized protein M6B38_119585 [Iris pallida]|uniref:Uncharacterized protein n=1 Tax=Iris pallida TaxID=29817 RepID=A0AAX6HA42_IRIPA|nr:uncharacterized protein M6B38_119585 [Iris pallida]